ncbi:MAG: hypothetical protein ACOXZX_00725 [Synergistaceae bacterium]
MRKYSVILADKSRLFTDAIRNILKEEPEFNIVSDVSCGIEAIRAAQSLRPDILVIGQVLPDITMFQVVREVYRELKNTKFMFIVHDETSELLRFLSEIHTLGVIRYNSDIKEFITALRSIARGERYISKEVINDLRVAPKEMPEERFIGWYNFS